MRMRRRSMLATAVVVGGAAHMGAKSAQNNQAQQPAPVAETAAAPQDDLTVQLEQLNDLKNKGILTQEEFDAKKKQLLGI